jgi:hypothetical protein
MTKSTTPQLLSPVISLPPPVDTPMNTPVQNQVNSNHSTLRAVTNASSGIQVEGFNGSKSKYQTFMQHVLLLFAAESKCFQTDAQKFTSS